MRRVVVYGNGGAGKSTLARTVADAMGGTHIELDVLAFSDDYAHVAMADLRAGVLLAIAADRWVAEGMHRDELDVALEKADTFVWLDLPRRTIARRLGGRVVTQLVTGRRRHGQRTTVRSLRNREVPFVRKTITGHDRRRVHGEAFSTRAAARGVAVVHLTTPHAVRRWTRQIAAGSHGDR